ncbi:MAG: hypothetical protein ACK5NG_07530 [Chthoniobacterales bacterium]
MKKLNIFFTLLFLLGASLPASATVDDALSFAYEAATPFVKKGFTFREDAWGGDLGEKDQKAVSAQLFKGNQYWFVLASDIKGAVVTVHVYDSDGTIAESKYWNKGSFAGALVTPSKTGTYWAIITVEKSPDERTPWALVYGFK